MAFIIIIFKIINKNIRLFIIISI